MRRLERALALGVLGLCAGLSCCEKNRAPQAQLDAGLLPSAKTGALVQDARAVDAASSDAHAFADTRAALQRGEPRQPGPRMRVSAQRGTALPVGTDIDQTLTVQLAAGDALTLSLDDYVRVELHGPATAQLLPTGQAALLLRDGLATVDVSPRGMHSLAGVFWLATPAGHLEVADSVRVAVRAFPTGPSQIEVVSGYLTLSQAAAPVPMPAGSAACATLERATLTRAQSQTLERAATGLASARVCAQKARVTSAQLESALTDQLHLVSEAAERERVLLVEHDNLVATHDGGAREANLRDGGANTAGANEARAREVRLALARTGGELLRARARARALRAQFEASALGRQLSAVEQPLLLHATKLLVLP